MRAVGTHHISRVTKNEEEKVELPGKVTGDTQMWNRYKKRKRKRKRKGQDEQWAERTDQGMMSCLLAKKQVIPTSLESTREMSDEYKVLGGQTGRFGGCVVEWLLWARARCVVCRCSLVWGTWSLFSKEGRPAQSYEGEVDCDLDGVAESQGLLMVAHTDKCGFVTGFPENADVRKVWWRGCG